MFLHWLAKILHSLNNFGQTLEPLGTLYKLQNFFVHFRMSVHVSSYTSVVEVSCSYIIVKLKLNSQSSILTVRQINNSLVYKAATLGPNQSQMDLPQQSALFLRGPLGGKT